MRLQAIYKAKKDGKVAGEWMGWLGMGSCVGQFQIHFVSQGLISKSLSKKKTTTKKTTLAQ